MLSNAKHAPQKPHVLPGLFVGLATDGFSQIFLFFSQICEIPACFSEANHCSRPVLQRPAPVLAEAMTRRGFWRTQDLMMWFLSFFFLQVASFFVAMVVMVTMLALGIYLEPLPKVTRTNVQTARPRHRIPNLPSELENYNTNL